MITALAKDHMFAFNDAELEKLEKESKLFLTELVFLNDVDTSSVEAMSMPYEEVETHYLREDVAQEGLPIEDVFMNAQVRKDDFFEIVKVLK